MGTRSKPESWRSKPRIMAGSDIDRAAAALKGGNRHERRKAATLLRQHERAMRKRG
jgi:hypothetical protein